MIYHIQLCHIEKQMREEDMRCNKFKRWLCETSRKVDFSYILNIA